MPTLRCASWLACTLFWFAAQSAPGQDPLPTSAERDSLAATLKRAELGYPDAQFSLGVCYIQGTGVPKDEAEAVKWFRRMAIMPFWNVVRWSCIFSCIRP